MLAIIQVGHVEASDRYIRNKVKAIEQAGMTAEVINLPESCTTLDVLDAIFQIDSRVDCKAIMVQLPLPSHIDKEAVLRNIPTHKDIDGLNPHSDLMPLTPCAIMRWLKERHIRLPGKNVTILGRSELVGKPLANLMIDAGATVTVLNSVTEEWFRRNACYTADIIVSAVGKCGAVFRDYVNNGKKMVVIDVGINRDNDGKLCGDVSHLAKELVERNGGICTPVPGGVGKWTVRELVIRLAEMEGKSPGKDSTSETKAQNKSRKFQ